MFLVMFWMLSLSTVTPLHLLDPHFLTDSNPIFIHYFSWTAGSFCGFWPPDAPWLWLGQPPSPRWCRHGWCCDRHSWRREDALWWNSTGEDVCLNDNEWSSYPCVGHVYCDRRGAGRAESQTNRHNSKRYFEGVYGTQHLYFPSGTFHARHCWHLRLYLQGMHPFSDSHLLLLCVLCVLL